MHRDRATKICATLGPASSTRETIEALFLKGADVFRFNFSHGSHEVHRANYDHVRAISQHYDRPIAILQDLQGPKLRIGTFTHDSIILQEGAPFRLDLCSDPGNERRVSLPHPEIFAVLQSGTDLLLDDGRIRLHVHACTSEWAETTVRFGGKLSNRKGVNVPDVALDISPLTIKDRADLDFGLALGVDWVALSFVQRPEDVQEAHDIIKGRARIMSKLEKPQAIDQLDQIINLSDAIMVARGDLGVEMPPENVPCIQRHIIKQCRAVGKPVMVATQMLDSMVSAPTPTRAEASDVATAVYEGVDAVMLSAESASGQYPIESVAMMDRIIKRVESDSSYHESLEKGCFDQHSDSSDAISAAARQVAHMISAAAIVSVTQTGGTALRTCYERPHTRIVALTPNQLTANQLALVWGCHPIIIPEMTNLVDVEKFVTNIMLQQNFAQIGDNIVMTAGAGFLTQPTKTIFQTGTTRLLHILTL